MQTLPTFTESGGHLGVPAPADRAASQTMVHTTTEHLRIAFMVAPDDSAGTAEADVAPVVVRRREMASTPKTPPYESLPKLPPRANATGILPSPPLPFPPKQLMSSLAIPVSLFQNASSHLFESAQSATHSNTLPTMSNTPHADLQLDARARVHGVAGAKEVAVRRPVVRSPGSGVPAAAACHSRFVRRRLPESRHA